MNTVFFLRGTQSAGKSTVAETIRSLANRSNTHAVVCCADDYFTDTTTGEYKFNGSKLGAAHKECQDKYRYALEGRAEIVIVANTNADSRSIDYYQSLAESHNYLFFSLIVERRHDNKNHHNVPESAILATAEKIVATLKLF